MRLSPDTFTDLSVSHVLLYAPTILDKIFGTKWGNRIKLDKSTKPWYLFSCTFWLLLPIFLLEGRLSPPKFEIFLIFSNWVVRQHVRQLNYKLCYTRYQVPLYFWRIGPVKNTEKFQNIMNRIVGIPYCQFLYTDIVTSSELISITLIAGVGWWNLSKSLKNWGARGSYLDQTFTKVEPKN